MDKVNLLWRPTSSKKADSKNGVGDPNTEEVNFAVFINFIDHETCELPPNCTSKLDFNERTTGTSKYGGAP